MSMGLKGWYSSQNGGVQAAVIAGALAVVGAVVTGVFSLVNVMISNSNQAPPSSAVATVSPSSPAPPTFTMDYPRAGSHVSRQAGFTAGGTVTGPLGIYTIWLVDHPSYGYVVDVKATIQDRGLKWQAVDQPLGDSSDHLPYKRKVIAVLANPHCTLALTRLGSSAGGNQTRELPFGCIPVWGTTVNVTKP